MLVRRKTCNRENSDRIVMLRMMAELDLHVGEEAQDPHEVDKQGTQRQLTAEIVLGMKSN